VEFPLLLQFSIALFTGMVAATFVPPVRKVIPRPVEIFMWVGLVSVCVLGVTNITDPNARELSASAAWGADQIINTGIGLMLGGAGFWVTDHRFSIASWLVIIAGVDIFALMFLNSRRGTQRWQPRIRLREWMELPPHATEPVSDSDRIAAAVPVAGINRRVSAATAVAATATLAGVTHLSIWLRDVMVPREAHRIARAAKAGRVGSHARLDSLRDATAHLHFAARTWYAAAAEPALSGFAFRTVRAARRRLKPVALRAGEVVDIQALLGAQSIGWYGPLSTGPAMPPGEHDAAESQRSDRLAS
jgi:hypothetical protein